MYRTPPNFEEGSTRLTRSRRWSALCSRAGVPVAQALAGSGIAESRLHAPGHARLLPADADGLSQRAPPVAGPCAWLRAGQRMRVTAYGMYGYALLSSPSHAAAIDLALKYHRVMGPVADVSFSRSDGTAAWEYQPHPVARCRGRLLSLRPGIPVLQPSHAVQGPLRPVVRVRRRQRRLCRAGARTPVQAAVQVPGVIRPAEERGAVRRGLARRSDGLFGSDHQCDGEPDVRAESGPIEPGRRRCSRRLPAAHRTPRTIPRHRHGGRRVVDEHPNACAGGSKPSRRPTGRSLPKCACAWRSSTCARPT